MAEEKYCPLSFNAPQGVRNCSKEKCAWWDELAKQCAVAVIAYLGVEGSFEALRKEQKEGGPK